MPDIRLVCINIDGTLLNSHYQLPPENRAAVCWAEKKGAVICLMSTRPPGSALSVQQALGIKGPIACYGGGLLEYQGERLLDRRIPARTAALLVQECAIRRLHLSVYRDNQWYAAREDMWSMQESRMAGMVPNCAVLEKLICSWGNQGAHKLLCMGESEQLDRIYTALKKCTLSVRLQRSQDTRLEILPEDAGNAEVMNVLCDKMDIGAAQVIAFGCCDTDVPLLHTAGFGVAMGDASAAILHAAHYRTDTNDNFGLAKAIYKIFVGNMQPAEHKV